MTVTLWFPTGQAGSDALRHPELQRLLGCPPGDLGTRTPAY
jgi:hypothetical protein